MPQTYRQKLQAIEKVHGITPEELANHPAEPPHFAYIWMWFVEFPSPITWSEIKSWSELSGITPERWECELLIRLDYLRK